MNRHVKHLIIAVLVAAVVLLGTWKVLAYMGNISHDQNVLAQQKLKTDLETAKIQAQATKADTILLQQKIDGLTASNLALQRDVAGLRKALADQRTTDAQLDPRGLATRWNEILGVGQIKFSPDGLTADLPAAHATVDQLEQLPEKVQEIQKLTENSAQKDEALTQYQKTLLSTTAELDTCKKVTVLDMKMACDKENKDLKAQARKSKLKAFLYGAAAALGVLLGVKHGI